MNIPLKTQAQRIADINLLHLQGKIRESERLRQIFEVREQYEKKVEYIITNRICEK